MHKDAELDDMVRKLATTHRRADEIAAEVHAGLFAVQQQRGCSMHAAWHDALTASDLCSVNARRFASSCNGSTAKWSRQTGSSLQIKCVKASRSESPRYIASHCCTSTL